ncbi:MAG: AI-2E family transporter [Nanoarchaeota archaeon]
MQKEDYYKIGLVIVFLLIIYLSYIIIKPFISALLASVILAYIFYPIYTRINKKINNTNISAIITTLLLISIMVLPIIFIADNLIEETIKINKGGQAQKILDFSFQMVGPDFALFMDAIIKEASLYIKKIASELLATIPNLILNIFIMFFVIFFLFRDGKDLIKNIEALPMKDHQKEILFGQFKIVSKAVLYGWFIAALVQGVLGAIGFAIFGISNPIFWGFVMAILAMIPVIGTPIIWAPAGIWLIYSGSIISGIGLLIYGFLFISTIDNFVKPIIIGKKTKIHTVTIFLGIIGGIKLFGITGIVIGPLILSYLTSFIKIYGVKKHAAQG